MKRSEKTKATESSEGGKVLRFERRLAHPPERVWRALTEKNELEAWFPANVDGSLSEGARVRFDEKGGEGPERGVVREFSPPRTLEYTWGDRTLRWDITPAPGGCVLVFTTTARSASRTLAIAA